jgi:hypothetical protein
LTLTVSSKDSSAERKGKRTEHDWSRLRTLRGFPRLGRSAGSPAHWRWPTWERVPDRMAGWLDDSEPRGGGAHCCGWSCSLTLAQAAPVEAEFPGGRERGGDMLTKLGKDGRAYRLGRRES